MDEQGKQTYTPNKADRFFSRVMICLLLFPVLAAAVKWIMVVIVMIYLWSTARSDDLPREIDRVEQGSYAVILSAESEPVFFGSQNGSITLLENGKEISRTDFDLSNDGKYMNEYNWDVSWENDCVTVTIMGEEQDDEILTLYFNGETKKKRRPRTNTDSVSSLFIWKFFDEF
ncbi:hypothetical protein SAMN02910447_00129 [Ruminococcus sp. YE71]|uniref:hypothetical protein n=1 Tax=unclassified Ruminococcus TaxID=2608920 RepID=UPI00088B4845|nr:MULTISPECIES: hypothetical protein [unclassified Ruminococcus]SDA09887.1 hypothetical protein SAMN02910446_00220 [Ruminococcus sp. YE78]SFW11265.1 hypothetical protein SAMN02910447_00129 [Ruminococcus sp. YE71]